MDAIDRYSSVSVVTHVSDDGPAAGVLAVCRLAQQSVVHEIVEDDSAGRLADSKEARGLVRLETKPRHLAVGTEDQRYEVRPRWLPKRSSAGQSSAFTDLRVAAHHSARSLNTASTLSPRTSGEQGFVRKRSHPARPASSGP